MPEQNQADRTAEERTEVDNRRSSWLVPAIAALVGSLIGTAGTIGVTYFQDHNSNNQAVTTYLRSERTTVYSQFLTDVNGFQAAVNAYPAVNGPVESSDQQIVNDYSTIEVIGPPLTRSDATAVEQYADELDADYLKGQVSYAQKQLPRLAKDISQLDHSMRSDVQGKS